ncbi:hypothetical protein HanHA300_Chr07g0232551 [Helianthus annuus]|nr:hypothetical protein HanHA300_Chr07g0232551 [Helianthus annuus]KAJ0562300.1 hypothetical protein HanHA89_Chr07g0249711 [Helianthus annuus]KAJ0727676.1 hypothetical protein HanLR1_Chr07g0232491 [Helianthus annuus]KAJ0730474.1 hypothetical protein HanOQP8_Chr07g0240421 [Helianthus annuus]
MNRYFHRLLLWSSFIETVPMEIGQNPIDIDKTIKILEPDKTSGSGWHLSGKERVIFRQPSPKRKALLGSTIQDGCCR